ncbi:hypothetical protein EYF80_004691 [Liparis tanakae]|uniref:Uncharacterized protein n=1 Tax=Liparis tanakae TaxID=230148 RepID=A0A4Z2J4U2_9TELE|nr:hypothetical protein EYF80_004691 [Liparis tanakae]
MNTRERRCPEETQPHQPVRQCAGRLTEGLILGGSTDAVGSRTEEARKRQCSRGLIRAATGERGEET